MALTPRLDLRQSQSLVMTPQLQQAIKLLQLSNLELTSFVEQEIEQNPLLEKGDHDAPQQEILSTDEVAQDTPPEDIVQAKAERLGDSLASIDLTRNEDAPVPRSKPR